jgi:SAM-dependent methyltransferase
MTMDRARIPQLAPGARHPDWQRVYESAPAEALPWHFEGLDPDVKAELLGGKHEVRTALDLGCGLGSQAAALTALGLKATGTDISAAAVARAKALYPETDFIVDDATRTALPTEFDLVVDRGCFHVLDSISHEAYLKSLVKLLGPKGLFLLKVLSLENGNAPFGPLRFTPKEIHQIFDPAFRILSLRRTTFQGPTARAPIAWFTVMRRREPRG